MPFDPNSYNKTPDDPERDIKRENGSKTLAAIEAANKAALEVSGPGRQVQKSRRAI